jgi:O-antigen ligase
VVDRFPAAAAAARNDPRATPVRRITVEGEPFVVVRLAFALFVASLPFESVLNLESLSLSRIIGLAFFGIAGVLQPRICFRRPPAGFWWFALYYVVFLVNGHYQGNPLEWGASTLLQMLVLLWMASNLLRYERVFNLSLRAYIASCFVLSCCQALGITATAETASGRVSTFSDDANTAGAVLSLGLVALVGLAYGSRRPSRGAKLATWLCFGVIAIGIVRTGSRGALVALTAGILALVLRKGPISLKIRNAFVVGVGLTILVTLVASWSISRQRWERALHQGSMAGRENIYPAAWRLFLEKPVFGWGPGTNVWILGLVLGEGHERDTHNGYLWVLTEDGVVGGLPYILGAVLSLRAAWRGRTHSYGLVPLALVCSVLVVNLSLTWHFRKLFWLILAVAQASERPLRSARTRRAVRVASTHRDRAVPEGVAARAGAVLRA